MTLPTEIVDHILGVLHTDQDYTTLETCSVVFPQIVDRHLYSQITMYILEKPSEGIPASPPRCPFDYIDNNDYGT